MSATVLAFDFGLKNIGVAVGNTSTQNADELAALKAKDGIPIWDEIKKLLEEWGPQQIVVGLPLNMDGSDGTLAPHCRKFSNRLKEKFQLPVTLVDERLSSFDAKQEASERGRKIDYKNNPIDSIAARLVLESWLREFEIKHGK
jgi:putative Holliday junction resolvase